MELKSILVTGHKGLLGGALCHRLDREFRVLTSDLDYRDEKQVRWWFSVHRPNYVINCAAKVGGVRANRDLPVDFLANNLAIQSAVISVSHDYKVEKLISIGTSCLFPKDAPLPVSEDSLLTGPFEPSVQAYAIAKLAGYALCKAYHDQYGDNFMTACPSNLYGFGDNYGPSAHVIPALMSRLRHAISKGEPLTVWGDGSAVREFLFVDDAADAIVTVLHKWNRPDAINVGTGEGVSIRGLVEMLIAATRAPVEVVWDTAQPTGIQNKTFDISKLSSLGWKPSIKLRDGLWRTWLNYINTPNPRMK